MVLCKDDAITYYLDCILCVGLIMTLVIPTFTITILLKLSYDLIIYNS